jgi:hypothetical protein
MERITPENPKPERIRVIADPFIPDEPQRESESRENYWKDKYGNWRPEILQKYLQILRGQY